MTNCPELTDALKRFRERVEVTPVLVGGVVVTVTISAGVAVRQPGSTFAELYAEADRALYLANTGGRNGSASVSR